KEVKSLFTTLASSVAFLVPHPAALSSQYGNDVRMPIISLSRKLIKKNVLASVNTKMSNEAQPFQY
ncbi:hypothetical protein ACN6UZ_004343, partial [Cronobacter dublinensis]